VNCYKEAYLEVTTYFNFQCYFCPIGKITRTKQHFAKEKAFMIIQEIVDKNIAPQIACHLMGEPLLDPDLEHILNYAAQRNIKNRVVTNGFLLSKPPFRLKLKSCHVLDISLRAHNADEFLAIYPEKHEFANYLAGIKSFLVSKDRPKNMKVRIRMFITDSTQEILDNIGISFEFEKDNIDIKKPVSYQDNIELIFEQCLDWQGNTKKYPSTYFGECNEFTSGFSVLVDGKLSLCCWDYDGNASLGNVFTDGGVSNVLNSRRAYKFVEAFKKYKVSLKFFAECLGRSTLLKSLAYQGKCFCKSICDAAAILTGNTMPVKLL
jgi:MoaA/NifB/PqqE/SkfB family radical SAM enzyme